MADLRKCIGSTRFGIEPHDAPIEEFPKQPSQEDGLGRMCRTHWNEYTRGLAREAKARKVATGHVTGDARATRQRGRPIPTPAAGSQGDAG